jgi:hypothetical protein
MFMKEAGLSETLSGSDAPVSSDELAIVRDEAESVIRKELAFLREHNEDDWYFEFKSRFPPRRIRDIVAEHGLASKSMRVKLKIIEEKWKQLLAWVERQGTTLAAGIRDLNAPILRALELFFRYLNEFLASLAGVFSSVDAAKELKDAIMSSIDLYRGAKELAQGR